METNLRVASGSCGVLASVPSGDLAGVSSGVLAGVSTPTVLNVGSMTVQGDGTGVHHGNLLNFTVNQYIVPPSSEPLDTEVVNELVTDAIKINSDARREFLKLGAPESRGWCGDGLKVLQRHVPRRFHKWTVVLLMTSVVVVVSSVLFSVFGLHNSTHSEAVFNTSLVIVSRQEWGAQNATGAMDNNTKPIPAVIVAHTAFKSCAYTPECILIVREIQAAHQNSGMSDIAYNYLIGGDGKAYEGRGWLLTGAHTKNHNMGSLGVAFIGTYTSVLPDAAMVHAFAELTALGVALKYLSSDYDLFGQCQLKDTASPGLALMQNMTSWPHFNSTLSYDYCITNNVS